jgi:hypothetical protein
MKVKVTNLSPGYICLNSIRLTLTPPDKETGQRCTAIVESESGSALDNELVALHAGGQIRLEEASNVPEIMQKTAADIVRQKKSARPSSKKHSEKSKSKSQPDHQASDPEAMGSSVVMVDRGVVKRGRMVGLTSQGDKPSASPPHKAEDAEESDEKPHPAFLD